MKTLNIGNKKKQVGYLIRMDEKDSWTQKQLKQIQQQYISPPTYVRSGPLYLHPNYVVKDSSSPRMGWEHASDATLAMDAYIVNAKQYGVDPEERFDFKIVKITVIEEEY